MKKTFLKIVGYLSVALGFAGAFLPLVPTTPLLLLALWCFSRSSPKMNAWLLGNRMFGRYLKDYEQGRGIPKVVKVSSVIILWSSILFTTIVFTEAWWLRALLLLMALLVSVHILNLKTLLTGSKILVLIPTAMEGEKFAANLPPNVAVETIGIGPYRSAFNTYHHILRHRPRMAILAGIAGTYPGSGLSTGESRLVKAENAADLGSFLPEGFHPKFAERLECPYIPQETTFSTADSNTLSAASAPFVERNGAQLEHMEGASFFYACTQSGTPFLELRTISNRVGEPFPDWDIETATDNLARDLNRLIHELEA